MKKILLILCAVMMLSLLAGCPGSIKSVAVAKLPDKLTYIAGQDTELDLAGGEVTYYYWNASPHTMPMIEDSDSITHDIDFKMPGVYIVTVIGYIHKNDSQVDTFEIQVVSAEDYERIVNAEQN